ncbi:MAG: tetratricopeptide repeat protein [Verrucomicrobiae bacterium]|nr:tetratricopeptide repeat protein [Verrucomicrobiae bacterium]
MTATELEGTRAFPARVLPWLLAIGALLFYLLTFNPWVSLLNLPHVARAAGWTWQPELTQPAYFLVTWPLRWLPERWLPLAMNLFSAFCAALVLLQLARSVALLPHDRTWPERERETHPFSLLSGPLAWLPPVVAVLVCGLQLTFWEHATNATNEMFDLLLFAWAVRALLEYRLDGRDGWLYGAAFAWGVGMAGNFAMWGFLPLFLAALIWIRGWGFFQTRFLVRMALCGLAGLSVLVIWALIAISVEAQHLNLWQAIKLNLASQKYILTAYPKLPTRALENVEWVLLVVVCILPLLLYGIRWPSYFGDTSQVGVRMTTTVFHFMFGLYLVVCLWCLLDAPFSPRHKGYGIPFLTFYYLCALSVGYFLGYFLIVFGKSPARTLPRAAQIPRPVRRLVLGSTVGLAALAPALGLIKNLDSVRATNGGWLRTWASTVFEQLPDKAVVLSDDSRPVFLGEAWLARTGRRKDLVLLDTESLVWPGYHHHLQRRFPKHHWPKLELKEEQPIDPQTLVNWLAEIASRTDVWYLNPSFGYYFEAFYALPRRLVYELKPYTTAEALLPPLPDALVAQNESFWTNALDTWLQPLLARTRPQSPHEPRSLRMRLLEKLRLPEPRPVEIAWLGMFYSRALNQWAVELQRRNGLDRAATCFEAALTLNPDNPVARVNRDYNEKLRAGRAEPLELSSSLRDQLFGRYRTWDQLMADNGMYDEPGFCFALGDLFMRTRHFRQAVQQFERVRQLLPDDAISRLWLARLYVTARQAERALAIITELRARPDSPALSQTNRNELLALEARALLTQNQRQRAVQLLESAIARATNDLHLLMLASSTYFDHGLYSNALTTLERFLRVAPDNPFAVFNQGAVWMQLGDYRQAVAAFSRVWDMDTNSYVALLYRAICHLRQDRLDEAAADFETLQRRLPTMYQIHYGLGEICYRRRDTNNALKHYETYLACAVPSPTNAPPNPEEIRFVAKRIAELKGNSP